MHDPKSVAHEIKLPFKNKHGYRKSLVTIWHVDPETDGTDDSCGWFGRSRHLSKPLRDKVHKEFLFHYQHNYWFDTCGNPVFTVPGTVLNMFRSAAHIYFNSNHDKVDKWMNKHLAELLLFSENYMDSLHPTITRKYGGAIDETFMRQIADTVLCYIVRRERKWYNHPRWHINHWEIQIHWPRVFTRAKDQPCCDNNLRETV